MPSTYDYHSQNPWEKLPYSTYSQQPSLLSNIDKSFNSNFYRQASMFNANKYILSDESPLNYFHWNPMSYPNYSSSSSFVYKKEN